MSDPNPHRPRASERARASRRTARASLCGTAAAALCIAAVDAPFAMPVTVPAGLAPGDPYRLVFVTSTQTDATSGDIDDYNAFVTANAGTQPALLALGTGWSVIGSVPGADVVDNTGLDPSPPGANGVALFNLAGETVASDHDDLWDGTLAAAIDTGPDGSVLPPGADESQRRVWTGTILSGEISFTPLGLMTFVTYGIATETGSGWINTSATAPDAQYRLYGISDVLTVPTTVPEPGALAMLAGGIAAAARLGGWRARRRRGG